MPKNLGRTPTNATDIAIKSYIDGLINTLNGRPITGPVPAVGEWIQQASPGANGVLTQAESTLQVGLMALPAATYDACAINIGTAGTTGAVFRAAIYADNNGQPGALLAQSNGTVDGTATGVKTMVFPSTFTLNWTSYVFCGVVPQGGASTRVGISRYGNQMYNERWASAPTDWGNSQLCYSATSITGAVPTSWSGTARSTFAARFAFRRSA